MIPLFGKVSQHHEQPEIADVSATTIKAWREAPVASRLKSGMSVAVGVGSRGIVGLQSMVKATLEFLGEKGCRPFIVSAMGSHGGANAKGQRELLGEYGISEEALGVPVKSDMDSVVIGTNSWGEPVYWDKNALKADAVLTISRIKPHTDFRGKFESGILKMLVIGLGK
ncbi:MAG: lactate racemase domain-containing protein, partial [Planctomycetota bacterium]